MSASAREFPNEPERWMSSRDEAFQAYAETEGFPRCTKCGQRYDPDEVGSDATPGLCDPCDDGAA